MSGKDPLIKETAAEHDPDWWEWQKRKKAHKLKDAPGHNEGDKVTQEIEPRRRPKRIWDRV
jgi:hypothetical protein